MLIRSYKAFTLVELLAVMAIIGILVALLLPAIQAAREAARRTQCKNQLRQIALAMLDHEAVHGYLPTGGWGYRWVGDAGSGYGPDQPGSWAYNILEYLEFGGLRELGGALKEDLSSRNEISASRHQEMLLLVTTPIAQFMCPSRREPQGYPLMDPTFSYLAWNVRSCEAGTPGNVKCLVTRGDYRANAGNLNRGEEEGPTARSAATHQWRSDSFPQNGVIYQRSTVTIPRITDGSSKTALVGEKSLNQVDYATGEHSSDDQCVYSGHDQDNQGYTSNGSDPMPPVQDGDARRDATRWRFGSIHTAGMHMALCDGSVETIQYGVDEQVFALLGGRNDNDVIIE